MILTVTANAAIDKRYVTKSFEVGQVNRVVSCAATAGGKGLNVSRAARLAGEEVTATGFLGGHSGSFIEEGVKAQGIASEFVWCQGESRTCINIWDETHQTQTEFLEPGFPIGDSDMDRLVEHFSHLVGDSSIATISGSIPQGGNAKLYRRLIEKAEKCGKKVIVDTSGSLLEDCLNYHPYMIKPNMDEIRMLTGRSVDTQEELVEAARLIHAKGVPVVVISRGGEGSVISSQEGVFEARVPRIEAANTVGCGDIMTAGFAVGFSRGLSVPECIRLASAMSAAGALRLETGYFRKEDMEDLLPKIQVRQLAG